jgi:hypothetical protein
MNYSEIVVAAQIDEILRRAALRIERHRIHVRESPGTGPQASIARDMLREALAAFDRLRAHRAKFPARKGPTGQMRIE